MKSICELTRLIVVISGISSLVFLNVQGSDSIGYLICGIIMIVSGFTHVVIERIINTKESKYESSDKKM